MTPEQVEDAGWSLDVWSSLNELAVSTVEEHAQLRQIIPEGPGAPNAYVIEAPQAVGAPGGDPFGFDVTETRPVTRLRVRFKVKAAQLHDIPRIRQLVHRVAMRLAHVEDMVLAHGAAAEPGRTDATESENLGSAQGLFGQGTSTSSGPDVFDALSAGARDVRRNGYTGALRAVVGFDAWTAIARENLGSRVSGPDRARHTLGSLDALLAAIPPEPSTLAPGQVNRDDHLVVFAPDPAVLELVWARRPRLAHVETIGGDLVLRIEEAFLLRVTRDPKAISTVHWKRPPPSGAKGG